MGLNNHSKKGNWVKKREEYFQNRQRDI